MRYELAGDCTRESFTEYSTLAAKRAHRLQANRRGWSWIAVMLAMSFLIVAACQFFGLRAAPGQVIDQALAGLVCYGLGTYITLYWLISDARASMGGYLREGGALWGHRQFAIDDRGITVTCDHSTATSDWHAYTDVTVTPTLVVIWTDPGVGLPIPRPLFADAEQVAAFQRDANAWIEAGRAGEGRS